MREHLGERYILRFEAGCLVVSGRIPIAEVKWNVYVRISIAFFKILLSCYFLLDFWSTLIKEEVTYST